ncbi:uncharacterized protein LOC143018235 [Oratosquilla oratoria]|uniref:uncharacterized protein LOC143018235 n=1 Tax=Oratosquilla oratoria TaxID=337810 RepID=UPI003F769338
MDLVSPIEEVYIKEEPEEYIQIKEEETPWPNTKDSSDISVCEKSSPAQNESCNLWDGNRDESRPAAQESECQAGDSEEYESVNHELSQTGNESWFGTKPPASKSHQKAKASKKDINQVINELKDKLLAKTGEGISGKDQDIGDETVQEEQDRISSFWDTAEHGGLWLHSTLMATEEEKAQMYQNKSTMQQDQLRDEGAQSNSGITKGNSLASGMKEDNLDGHKSDDSSGCVLVCPVCFKQFEHERSLNAHMSRAHNTTLGPCFTCHVCGAVGRSKATLKRHLAKTHGLQALDRPDLLKKCRHCNKGLKTQDALYHHLRTEHTDLLHNYHKCPQCPALVSTRPSLLRHFSRSHPNVELPHDFVCSKCDAQFVSKQELKTHIKLKHEEHKCEVCNMTFKYSCLLIKHTQRMHMAKQERKKHHCEDCGRVYRFLPQLNKHRRLVHTHPEERVYKCSFCQLSFTSYNQRLRHYRATHRAKRKLRCVECSLNFETLDEFNLHRLQHKFKCSVCFKVFLSRDSIREHMLIHNGPRLPCPHCTKTFTQRSNLRRHIRIHTGEKPYKCTYCDKCFGDKSSCNSHIKVHTGAERCVCHVCGVTFSKRLKLNYHLRSHTGEGLLYCPLCSKACTNTYSFRKHVESHQGTLTKVLSNMGLQSIIDENSMLIPKALQALARVEIEASNFEKKKKEEAKRLRQEEEEERQGMGQNSIDRQEGEECRDEETSRDSNSLQGAESSLSPSSQVMTDVMKPLSPFPFSQILQRIIMESQSKSDAPIKPTLGDLLVEQCLQVIMSEEEAGREDKEMGEDGEEGDDEDDGDEDGDEEEEVSDLTSEMEKEEEETGNDETLGASYEGKKNKRKKIKKGKLLETMSEEDEDIEMSDAMREEEDGEMYGDEKEEDAMDVMD